MRATLRAISARLVVGHIDPEQGAELLATIDTRGKPITFALAEPEGLRMSAAVPAGMAADGRSEPLRWGKLVLETVANEALASPRKEVCDAIVDGLRVAHRRLGVEGLDIMPHGNSGIGFCAACLIDGRVQLVVVPPSQIFVVHQGVALSVPQSDDVGRGIWMRDDLRAEMFAGVGGAHEPDIRVYDASIMPGDALVLVSSSLARMLTEDDVRLAVAYEEAATGAERLKQLAIQRGVEAGIALVVEVAGSFEDAQPDSPLSGPIVLGGVPRPGLKLEMPPIGSIFSTARDWLLEAVDRAQATPRQVPAEYSQDEDDDPNILWPARPGVGGATRARRISVSEQVTSRTQPAVSRPASSSWPSRARSIASDARSRLAGKSPHLSSPTAVGEETGGGMGSRPASLSLGWRALAGNRGPSQERRRPSVAGQQLLPALARSRAALSDGWSRFASRAATFDFASKRRLLVPAVAAVLVLLVLLAAVRTIKGQQTRQIQQRFDSLVTAAAQLEGQARIDADHNEAQGLVRRAQALLDQATTLQPNQPRVASVRKDLQDDLDRMDSVVVLPQPAVLANFAGAAKDVNVTAIAADGQAFYGLDGGGQRLLQVMRQSSQSGVAASKGDKSGTNQLGVPKLLTVRDNGALLLDSNRALWSYSAAKPKLEQIGLKSAETWKDATAMSAYGPNLYVLDATLGNVWRYASRDGIFTDAPTRFFDKDNPDLLRQGVSLAIDGSIWVLTADGQILKLEAGAGQPLAINGLTQPIGKASQIATQAGFSSLYVLNAAGNRVFEIGKDGRYIRQFSLGLPNPVTSIWPDQPAHQLAVLSGNNLYQYQLPS
jgi:hypothetical protein